MITFTFDNCVEITSRLHRGKCVPTSKYLGVSITKEGTRYRASTRYMQKYKYLGTFATDKEAAKVRDAFVKKHKIHTKLNFPDD